MIRGISGAPPGDVSDAKQMKRVLQPGDTYMYVTVDFYSISSRPQQA